jgi:cytochrome P450
VRSLDEAPYLDIFSPEFQADPLSRLRSLRQESAVIRTPIGVHVVDRAPVHDLLRNRNLHGALVHLVRLQGVNDGPLLEMAESSLLGTEGEDHTRIRRLVSRSFTPRAADAHRPFMRQLVEELIDRFAGRGECEFMADFADHYPVQVIAHLMGVPRDDHPLFARWGNSLTHLLSFELHARRAEVEEAQASMSSYLSDLVADRRARPRDDLVSELIGARDGSDRLNDQELLSLLGALLFAGYDTTRNQLAVAMTVFAAHPADWARLAAAPDLAPRAVEEVMRVAGVVAVVPRVTTVDIEVDGWRIPAGTLISLSLAGANHDPKVYEHPERFDIDADRSEGQIGFGGGAHHCLGANLARAEMQEALPILARSLPDLQVAHEPEWRGPMTGIGGPLRLDLRFSPPAEVPAGATTRPGANSEGPSAPVLRPKGPPGH